MEGTQALKARCHMSTRARKARWHVSTQARKTRWHMSNFLARRVRNLVDSNKIKSNIISFRAGQKIVKYE